MRALYSVVLLVLLLGALNSCRSKSFTGHEFSFSANAGEENVALLMTAYGSTPNNINLFENDMNNMKKIIEDPKGKFGFNTIIAHNVQHSTLTAKISEAAGQVSENGTFFLFITAHGSSSGSIQPTGQAYATVGLRTIQRAIATGRAGKGPFKRLVLFISACYSGSWLPSFNTDPKLYSEAIAITSVDSRNLSSIGYATRAMLSAFRSFNDPSLSTEDFIKLSQRYDRGIRYRGIPASILSDPFIGTGDRKKLSLATVTTINGNEKFLVAASSVAQKVKICASTAEVCIAGENVQGVVIESKPPKFANFKHKLFTSSGLKLENLLGKNLVAITIDKDNQVIAAKSFQIERR